MKSYFFFIETSYVKAKPRFSGGMFIPGGFYMASKPTTL